MNLKNINPYDNLSSYIKYFPQSNDIAYIKLIKNKELFNDIKFLYYDTTTKTIFK